MDQRPRVVFMGSPDFAVPSLRGLAEICEMVGVVTQPDKPAGRGMKLTPPAVKIAAVGLNIPIIQPKSLKEEGAFDQIRAWAPDLIVVVAFGQLLRKNVLDLPRFGCLNVHASLLPAYRGAAPIQAALLNGDQKTGVTIMRMDEGLDTGPILFAAELPISQDETTGTLSSKLSQLGSETLLKIMPEYLAGKLEPTTQPVEGASYFGMIRKPDGQLSTNLDVVMAERKIRAYNPWPGASLQIGDESIKIHQAAILPGNPLPGSRMIRDGYPAIGFQGGWLSLINLQPAGKKAMDGKAFLAGKRDWVSP